MGIDQGEAKRRRQVDRPKLNTDPNRPYAAIPHRVIDSSAFADLTPSEVQVLVLLVRQLAKDNNGRLHAARTYLANHGVASEHTIQRAIRGLIEHGFVFRTKAGGYGLGAAHYAVTWLPLGKNRDGLTHTEWFRQGAWHQWIAEPLKMQGAINPRGHRNREKKNPPKVQADTCTFGRLPDTARSKTALRSVAKTAHDELVPVGGTDSPDAADHSRVVAYLAKLTESGKGNGAHAERVRGHLGLVAGAGASPKHRAAARKRLAHDASAYLERLRTA